jgi:hypothetical protein
MKLRIRSQLTAAGATIWLVWMPGCDAQPAASRGASGESCTARSDCERGFACYDNRCGAAPAPADDDAGMQAAPSETRGGAGESCTRRADCSAGLACFANQCVDGAGARPSAAQASFGQRGESCRARNDCAPELACLANQCTPRELASRHEAKQCFRVQCELSEDCCKNFVAPATCPGWKTACASGDITACTAYDANCSCNMRCTDSLCQALRSCRADTDCAALDQRCFAGSCAQCAQDADCAASDQHCIGAVCRAGCERNEQCPLFHECQASECVAAGCKSDRECQFATKDTQARCLDTTCVTPCQYDAQCAPLQVCADGRCSFVGCQTDEECRVFLNLANQPGPDRAVCRLPDA